VSINEIFFLYLIMLSNILQITTIKLNSEALTWQTSEKKSQFLLHCKKKVEGTAKKYYSQLPKSRSFVQFRYPEGCIESPETPHETCLEKNLERCEKCYCTLD
jgi:hypothetical protein